jgi:NAD(P)-dependent dehydrogenase (short-subunit alcohol dehydrogenase family)
MMDMKDTCFSLDGKVVALTGGSGLIGMSVVRSLPLYGARLVVGVRDVGRFEAQLRGVDFPSETFPPLCLPLDLADKDSIKAFFRQVQEEFQRLDILINSAFPRTEDWLTKFEDVEAESLYKNLCDHAGGYFLCCQEAAKVMKAQQAGVILNLGSIYGEVGPHFPIYAGTEMTCPGAYPLIKGGIHTFTRYLAAYLGPSGIRVNCLSPGGIKDESHQPRSFIDNYLQQTPLGRMAEPEDIIGPLIFLISEASRYVTGQVLFADGGWTCW